MEWEYNTKEEADTTALSLKHLIGKTIKHKNTSATCTVSDVFPFPVILRSNGEDFIKGYDVKIGFSNQPFSTWSKALEVAFILD
jgi:hypothetical protein